MNKLVLALALLLIVPALSAQQEPPQEIPARTSAPVAAQTPAPQSSMTDAIKPGHALDPADVDVLTGKRDREIVAAQTHSVSLLMGGYGNYGGYRGMSGRLGRGRNVPLLPFTRFANPFFFNLHGGFGRGGFHGIR